MTESCSECGGTLNLPGHDHIQVPVTDEYGVHAHVDEGIAPLIEACWGLRIITTGSCQGSATERANIGFPPGYAESFALAASLARTEEAMVALPDEALDWRIYLMPETGEEARDVWQWIPGYPWSPGWSVHFPPGDIPELTRRLRRLR